MQWYSILLIIGLFVIGVTFLIMAIYVSTQQTNDDDDAINSDCLVTSESCISSSECCGSLECSQDGKCCDRYTCRQDAECCGPLRCNNLECSNCRRQTEACDDDKTCCMGMTCGEDGTCGHTCVGSEDCGAGFVCQDGQCQPCGISNDVCPCCDGYVCTAAGICTRERVVGQTCGNEDICEDGSTCVDGTCVCYDVGKATDNWEECCSWKEYGQIGLEHGQCCQVEDMYCKSNEDCCGDGWLFCNDENQCQSNIIHYGDEITITNVADDINLGVNSDNILKVDSQEHSGSDVEHTKWIIVNATNIFDNGEVDLRNPFYLRNTFYTRSQLGMDIDERT